MIYKILKQFRTLILIILILLILISSKKLNTTSLLQKKEVYDSNDKLLKTINYKYNFKNKIIKENYEYTDKSDVMNYKGYIDFKYNLNGTLQSKIEYTHLDEMLQTFYYEYNFKKKIIECVLYDSESEPVLIYEYNYYSNDKLEKKVAYALYESFEQIHKPVFECEYKYDRYIDNIPVEYSIYQYGDDNNLLIKTKYKYIKEIIQTITYEYNENGDLIRENKYDKENNLEEYALYYYKE